MCLDASGLSGSRSGGTLDVSGCVWICVWICVWTSVWTLSGSVCSCLEIGSKLWTWQWGYPCANPFTPPFAVMLPSALRPGALCPARAADRLFAYQSSIWTLCVTTQPFPRALCPCHSLAAFKLVPGALSPWSARARRSKRSSADSPRSSATKTCAALDGHQRAHERPR